MLQILCVGIVISTCVFGCFVRKYVKKNLQKNNLSVIFDFDSTLVKNETLIDMLSLALNGDKEKIQQIENITKDAMNGLLTPQQSMNKRLQFATINKEIVEKMTEQTKQNITDGMADLIKKLQQKNVNIYIVSGGFREVILPTADILGIKNDNVFANDFLYDGDFVSGVKDNILLEKQGKVKVIQNAKKEKKITGKTIIVGDGFTDLEVGLYKATDDFIAFTGVVERENVVEDARKNKFKIAKNTDELLKIIENKLDN